MQKGKSTVVATDVSPLASLRSVTYGAARGPRHGGTGRAGVASTTMTRDSRSKTRPLQPLASEQLRLVTGGTAPSGPPPQTKEHVLL